MKIVVSRGRFVSIFRGVTFEAENSKKALYDRSSDGSSRPAVSFFLLIYNVNIGFDTVLLWPHPELHSVAIRRDVEALQKTSFPISYGPEL